MSRYGGRDSYEVTGYTGVDMGIVVCPNCIGEIMHGFGMSKDDFNPIFISDEFDGAICCDHCHEEIEVTLEGSDDDE